MIRQLNRVHLIVAAAAAWAMAAPSGAETGTQVSILSRDRSTYPYLLFTPLADVRGRDTLWPLIVFLHGSGEQGDNLDLVKGAGLPKRLETDATFPFIVVSPQLPQDDNWDVAKLDRLLDQVLAEHPVDVTRVYLTGLSLGGYAVWDWASASPHRFAAIAPVAGDGLGIDPCKSMRGVAVWAFHGDSDRVVDPRGTFDLIQKAINCRMEARMTLYPGVGHEGWTQAYADESLYLWLWRHQTKPGP